MNYKSKLGFIIILIIGILFFNMPSLYATDIVTFVGDDEVETGISQTITIHVTYSEEIGVLEGTLSYDTENIEEFTVNSSYNGWTTTYNETTGSFNSLYAYGTTDDDVLEITYTLKEGSTSGYITLSDISLTTISYSTIDAEDITITITGTTSSSSDDDTNTSGTSSNSSSNSNSNSNSNSSTTTSSSSSSSSATNSGSNNSSSSASNTSTSTTSSSTKSTNSSNSSTNSSDDLPYTGTTKIILLGIVLFSIIGFLVYKRFKYYKEI